MVLEKIFGKSKKKKRQEAEEEERRRAEAAKRHQLAEHLRHQSFVHSDLLNVRGSYIQPQ